MKILILGGTQFVGRHIVEELVESGCQVSILNRGKSEDELPSNVERLRGDRDEGEVGLHALTGRVWDVCIDVSGYTAKQVRSSAAKLYQSVGHYIFISAVSVYGNPSSGPVIETHPRSEPAGEDVVEVVGEMYGRLKVTCENIVQDMFFGRSTLLRPQIIAGIYDPLDRFSYWVRRATQGGEMLAPGDGSDYLQFLDVRDFARFTRTVIERSLFGSFNLAGPRLNWKEFMNVLGAKNVVWVSAEIIKAAGVSEFELPLYRPAGSPRSSLMHVNNERAIEAGLTLRGPKVTVKDVRTWIRDNHLSPALLKEREIELIRMSR